MERGACEGVLECDVVSAVSGYMLAEFGGIDENEWIRCDKEDQVLQEVKKYVREGWPNRRSVTVEVEPYGKVPFLQEDGPDDGVVPAVEPVDSDEEEAEEEDLDNRDSVIQPYFQ
ncbi:hypothetical protein NDU88_002652 [Pleurodeles waltl]|uniref:Uncharacterized protein n=1 Tax=Pleurodeles waltl TaxID=8319 RepID=A0AAV7UWC1_PLEWA|nr:hypothetical protein NDU88_002652 [Pleurodeles waltl]